MALVRAPTADQILKGEECFVSPTYAEAYFKGHIRYLFYITWSCLDEWDRPLGRQRCCVLCDEAVGSNVELGHVTPDGLTFRDWPQQEELNHIHNSLMPVYTDQLMEDEMLRESDPYASLRVTLTTAEGNGCCGDVLEHGDSRDGEGGGLSRDGSEIATQLSSVGRPIPTARVSISESSQGDDETLSQHSHDTSVSDSDREGPPEKGESSTKAPPASSSAGDRGEKLTLKPILRKEDEKVERSLLAARSSVDEEELDDLCDLRTR